MNIITGKYTKIFIKKLSNRFACIAWHNVFNCYYTAKEGRFDECCETAYKLRNEKCQERTSFFDLNQLIQKSKQ